MKFAPLPSTAEDAHVLTGPGSVRTFSTANTEPAPVEVSLLVTPSIGCSPTESFPLVEGEFQRG